LPSPEGLGLHNNYLYVTCNQDGIKVFNVTNPLNPLLVKTITGGNFRDVIPYGNMLIAYVTTGILLYDISNPINPTLLQTINN